MADTPLPEKSALALRRLLSVAAIDATEIGAEDYLFDAPGTETVAAECAGVILADGDAARAATLLVSGAPRVLLGEAALLDSSTVGRLAQAHPGQIGIYARVRRQDVTWSFETISNADFKTVTPSCCEPAWVVLKADDTPTGTLAAWWLKAMRDLGATQFVVSVEVRDDTDLNILAGLVEDFGDCLWIAPRAGSPMPLAECAIHGQCRQLVLSADRFAQRGELFGAMLMPGALEAA